jgi:hypothetical protein
MDDFEDYKALEGFNFETQESKPEISPEAVDAEATTLAFANINPVQPENDVLAQLTELKEGYKTLVESYGSLEERNRISHDRNMRQLTAAQRIANDFQEDPELRQGAMSLIDQRIQEDATERAKRAAEEEAIEKLELLAATDPIQAQVMAQNILRPDAEGAYREFATKGLMLRNALGKFGVQKQEQSLALDALDFVVDALTTTIPGIRAEQMIDIMPGLEFTFLDKLWAPGVNRKSVGALWNMPMEEFTKFVNSDLAARLVNEARTFGYDSVSTQARLANTFIDGYSDNDYLLDGVEAGFTVAFAPGLVTASRIAKGGTLALVASMGGRSQAEKLAFKAMLDASAEGTARAAQTTTVAADELAAAVQTTATNVTGVAPPGIPYPKNAAEAFEKTEETLQPLRTIERAPGLTPEERTEALTWVTKKAEKATGRSEVLNVGTKDVVLADGAIVKRAVFQVGKKDGSLFGSEAGAKSAARAMGLGDVQAVQDTSGGFAIQFEMDIPENGFKVAAEPAGWNNVIKRFFGSSNANTTDDLQGIAALGRGARRRLYEEMVIPFTTAVKALNGTAQTNLKQVLMLGQHKATWFSDDEFLFHYRRSHSPDKTGTAKVAQEQEALQAYKAYIDANDAEWAVLNDNLWRQLRDDKHETVTLQTPIGQILNKNAKIDEDFDVIGDALKDSNSTGEFRIYNATLNTHYTQRTPLLRQTLENFKKQGYVLVNLQESKTFADGTVVQKILVKKGELSRRPLSRIQLPYEQGGHRPVEGNYFIKKAMRTTQADTGNNVLLSPRTYRSASSPAAARKWADTMNAAVDEAVKGGDAAAINAIFEAAGTRGFPSAQEFLDDFAKGLYGDGKDKFEAVFDRELPSAYTTGGIDPKVFMDEVNVRNSRAGMAAVHGKLYYGHKGDEVLRDVEGELATIVDPFTSMEQGLNNVARMSSLYEYRSRAIEQWVKTFSRDLERYDINQSPMEVFLHGKVKDSLPFNQKNQIEAQREAIKRVLRFKTKSEEVYEQSLRQTAEWVMGEATEGARVKAGNFILDMADTSITGTIRSFVFDMTLGMFNVAQLPLQISTALAAVTLSPKNGFNALGDYMTLRFVRAQAARDPKRFSEYLNNISQNGTWKTRGFSSAQEQQEFLRYSVQGGLFNLGDSHGLIDNFGSTSAYSGTGQAISRFREAGRFFFNEAEIINQFTAYGIAWREIRSLRPNLDFKSAAFKQEVARRTQDYGFRMMDESQAAFQRGLPSLPTQFWAYPIRMMEAMAGRQFTSSQRARLVAGQFLLWGSAGMPFLDLITEAFEDDTQVNSNRIGTLGSLRTRGLVDNLIYAAFDADVMVGKRVGVGTLPGEIIKSIMGENSFGQVAPINLATGASLSVISNTAMALAYVFNWQVALNGSTEDLDLTDTPAIEKLARQVTSVNNAMNAYYAFQYGKLVSRNGTIVTDMNNVEAGFAAFGIPPGDMDAISAMMSYNKNKKEKIASAVKVLNQLDNEWKLDPSKYEENKKLAQLFMAIQPKEWQDEIRRQHNRNQRSEYDTLHEGLEDRIAKDIEQREQQ